MATSVTRTRDRFYASTSKGEWVRYDAALLVDDLRAVIGRHDWSVFPGDDAVIQTFQAPEGADSAFVLLSSTTCNLQVNASTVEPPQLAFFAWPRNVVGGSTNERIYLYYYSRW
eukprot:tig00020952_g16480.t1